jgi:hypothetical protein
LRFVEEIGHHCRHAAEHFVEHRLELVRLFNSRSTPAIQGKPQGYAPWSLEGCMFPGLGIGPIGSLPLTEQTVDLQLL